MNTYIHSQRPVALRVGLGLRGRCAALIELLRPDEVVHVAIPLALKALENGWSAGKAVAVFLATAVSHGVLRWKADPKFDDIWRSPAESLRRREIDCEDFAILAFALLGHFSVIAELVVGIMYADGKWEGHAWIEGYDEVGFFLLEATTGTLYRARPWNYHPHHFLAPYACRAA